jgi:ribonuclease HI
LKKSRIIITKYKLENTKNSLMQRIIKNLQDDGGRLRLIWIRTHSGIKENEKADQEAKTQQLSQSTGCTQIPNGLRQHRRYHKEHKNHRGY